MTGFKFYRRTLESERLFSFTIAIKETDLWIAVSREAFSETFRRDAEAFTRRLRLSLEQYLKQHPCFKESFKPCRWQAGAPPVVCKMAAAAAKTGVGPMAAVAGALAEEVGRFLMTKATEVIVENGGDIFIKAEKPVTVGIYAGSSPLSGHLALKITPGKSPLGVCTSSGTVGHAFSFGRADAATALASSVALADAAATALGNRVHDKKDLEQATLQAAKIEGLSGALLIKDENIAAWGEIELVSL